MSKKRKLKDQKYSKKYRIRLGKKHSYNPNISIKIISWNVNGLKALIKKRKYLTRLLKEEDPLILCLQETKLQKECKISISGYNYCFNYSKKKKGYSGTAIYLKKEYIKKSEYETTFDMNIKEHDDEGRIITLEFEKFYLINCYTPNSGYTLERLEYRTEKWDKDFYNYINTLNKKKPVILCGDLNVSHEEEDVWKPSRFRNKPGFTDKERNSFNTFLKNGNYIDTFRMFHKNEKNHFSYWSYRGNQRKKNQGFHPDLFIVSDRIKDIITDSYILKNIKGSDHCPVGLIINKK